MDFNLNSKKSSQKYCYTIYILYIVILIAIINMLGMKISICHRV